MASVAEPTEQTKDMAAYAEQVVKEVAAERAGEQPEPKSDAQITSEHAGKPANNETTAETKSGTDTAEVKPDDSEDTAEVTDQGDDGREWLDDDLKAEVAAFGIEESELADFASRDEVERALRLFDKSALEVGRKALAEPEDEGSTARNEKGQFAKKEEPKADPPETRDGRYEFKADIYDEDLEGDLKGFRDYVDQRLTAVEARFAEAAAESEAIAEERHYDNLVDSLGHDDLFGKTDKENAKQKERREDLFVEVKTYLKGREVLGRPAELNETVVNRIARSLFADELGKKELKTRTRKIAKQSNGRQGGGTTRPQDPREDPRDEFDRLYRQLDRG